MFDSCLPLGTGSGAGDGAMTEAKPMKKVHTDPDFCEVPMSPLAGGPTPRTVRLTRALPMPKTPNPTRVRTW